MSSVPIQARISTASPRWLPRKRIGLTTSRLMSASPTPASTATQKMSWAKAMTNAPGTSLNRKPCHNASTIAWAMAVSSTRKPQKMSA